MIVDSVTAIYFCYGAQTVAESEKFTDEVAKYSIQA